MFNLDGWYWTFLAQNASNTAELLVPYSNNSHYMLDICNKIMEMRKCDPMNGTLLCFCASLMRVSLDIELILSSHKSHIIYAAQSPLNDKLKNWIKIFAWRKFMSGMANCFKLLNIRKPCWIINVHGSQKKREWQEKHKVLFAQVIQRENLWIISDSLISRQSRRFRMIWRGVELLNLKRV